MISKTLDLFGFADSREKEKIDNSMHLVDDLRVSPFMPIEKISHNSKLHKDFVANGNRLVRTTSWGELEIRNRLLTQNHLEILSVIMANKREARVLQSGRIAIYFSMYDIAIKIGLSWSGRTSKELEENIKQISDLNIIRHLNNGDKASYRILDNVAYSDRYDMWGIVLSDEYTELFKRGITIGYHKRLDEIIQIKGKGAGLVKAVIHFFITHDNTKQHRIGLIQLLDTLGYPKEDRQFKMAITALNKAKEDLAKFQIFFYSKDRVLEYNGAEHIRFLPALPIVK